jgi:hypothetical protein
LAVAVGKDEGKAMSRFYRRYSAVHYQYIYIGKITIANTQVHIDLSNGGAVDYGGTVTKHDLYFAINRDYQEWDQDGNFSYEEFQNHPGLVANIPKELDFPLEGKQKFVVDLNINEIRKHIGVI